MTQLDWEKANRHELGRRQGLLEALKVVGSFEVDPDSAWSRGVRPRAKKRLRRSKGTVRRRQ